VRGLEVPVNECTMDLGDSDEVRGFWFRAGNATS
jgi:hypothetical protein